MQLNFWKLVGTCYFYHTSALSVSVKNKLSLVRVYIHRLHTFSTVTYFSIMLLECHCITSASQKLIGVEFSWRYDLLYKKYVDTSFKHNIKNRIEKEMGADDNSISFSPFVHALCTHFVFFHRVLFVFLRSLIDQGYDSDTELTRHWCVYIDL